MDVVPVVDPGLGNSAYVVDLGDGGGLVVDPERDPRPHLAELDRRGLAPRWVLETHLHADFVSGGRELAAAGARLVAPVGGGLAHDHRALADGDELDLGGLVLEAIATPGHTPEHLAYLLRDGPRPLALFSGGTLTAGGVARTDLIAPELTEPLARQAYRSIHERLLVLSDDLPVLPTHGPGSFCSVATDGERTTTIGQARSGALLGDDPDEDTFVARLLSGYGSFPPYFLALREVNRAGPTVFGPTPRAPSPLAPGELEQAVAGGAELIDVRDVDAFAAGHVPGALSIPWRDQFSTWLGWLVDRDRVLVFVTDGQVDGTDLVWACLLVGHERLGGVLDGGMGAWRESDRPVATTPLVGAADVGQRRIVDIRQRAEYSSGHVADATHVELGSLAARPDEAGDGPALVHCARGPRAMTAASLLERAGRVDVAVLDGGPDDLARAGHRMEAGA